jgi:hypothetical protein
MRLSDCYYDELVPNCVVIVNIPVSCGRVAFDGLVVGRKIGFLSEEAV